jgi:hypothetical protein
MVRGTGEGETRLVCLARALNKECVLFYPSPPPPPLPRPLLLLFCFPFPSLVGVTWTDENALIRRYGSRYAEYHDIPVEYVLPTLSASLMTTLARDYSWTHILSSTPALERDARDVIADRLQRVTAKVDAAATAISNATAVGSRGSSSSSYFSGGRDRGEYSTGYGGGGGGAGGYSAYNAYADDSDGVGGGGGGGGMASLAEINRIKAPIRGDISAAVTGW